MTPEEKLKYLPDKPGVYLFRDAGGIIIYVGKALSLKNRVRSYFQSAAALSVKVRSLMSRAADFEYIVTDSEVEALILEANLIKEHRPRYNVSLRDDKSYPYIKVTLNEEYPRAHITRRLVKDGGRYYGPYTRAGAVHETLSLLKRLFPLRSCKQKEFAIKSRPCLNYHIKRCTGPCCGMIEKENYLSMVREVCLFLEGKQEELVKRLTRRMEDASEKLEFERAAEIRDQLRSIKDILEKQKVISSGAGDQDAVAMARGVDDCCVMVFFIRNGKLLGRERFILNGTQGDGRAEVLTAFIKQYYHRADFIPSEILVSDLEPGEMEVISSWLAGKKGSRVQIKIPVRGEKKQLIDMVAKNALLALEEAQLERIARRDGQEELALLARELGLEKPPYRMECFDISNIQGAETVASMAVFQEGKPSSDQYRRFKIKTVQGPDDFASMKEVIRRRFSRGREEKELIDTGQLSSRQAKFHRMPDLVIIDGGKGQLSAALEAMEELGIAGIPIFGLAKEEELLFAPGRPEPIRLPRDSRALYLLQRLRDEAHRFAVSYHRQLRTKRNLKSLLEEIEGIGEVRRRELARAYPSIEAIGGASVEELAAVPGMNRRAAEAVARFFSFSYSDKN
ncbi:excinuclease ABC subunit C [Desulfocucumis palustris]|uniref:UvrABC system protein C n=1 Tax=Desulfocucumis palustris TaxID=1898651 RepID=A0A2L2XHC7_9FIRM|nr:excinuclease ABC subunit UvrC [Desulfocucumis palustris]GBF35532.1 excinuclease ABC subunit C [Desulfocucumis palustris]